MIDKDTIEKEQREEEQEKEIKDVKLGGGQKESEGQEPKSEPAETEKPGKGKRGRARGEMRGRRGQRGRARGGEDREFEQRILDIARVTRVTKGGKRMRFRTLVVIGDKKSRVGYGVEKGADVAISVEKSLAHAKKNLITVPLINETIPHEAQSKFSAAKVLLKPASRGTGVKAGGAVRIIMELAGIPNITGKILGSQNKINNVKATFQALGKLKKPQNKE